MNIEAPAELLRYLRASGRIAADETIRMTPLRGGVSNRVVLVERADGRAWVLKQALARLRVATEWFSDPARVHREAAGLRCLARLVPGAVPDFLFEDHATHVLAMSAVPQPHDNWKTLLLAGRLEEARVRQFAQLLARIHRRSSALRDALAPCFADRRYFESLRLEPYYGYTADRLPPAAGFLRALISETRACRLALVHGDYSPKNVLLHRRRLILLDHEVIHLGDPAFDPGFALTHLLAKAHHRAGQREQFARAALLFWQEYRQHQPNMADAAFEARVLRHTLACLLARAAGRSPLEYLDEAARSRQIAATLPMLSRPPATLAELTRRFCERL